MRAPFPYYGGKARLAPLILERLEPCTVYVEPFAGSLAVLLQSREHTREIVCDTNGHIANFWRALRDAPDEVAYWADYPSYHHDLTARHRWLIEWEGESSERLCADPDYYDAQAAGWWVWGMALWIGAGWCESGVQCVGDTRPLIEPKGGGHGVSVQRYDKRPHIDTKGGGQGVGVARRELAAGDVGTGDRLRPWLRELAQRLARVVVLNRSWESALTPTVLMHTAQSPKPAVGIVLDPPYRTDTGRSAALYRDEHLSTGTAEASYEWAIEHGEVYRIAYCCQEGDFPVPPGWDSVELSFAGHNRAHERRDHVMFSPACVRLQERLL